MSFFSFQSHSGTSPCSLCQRSLPYLTLSFLFFQNAANWSSAKKDHKTFNLYTYPLVTGSARSMHCRASAALQPRLKTRRVRVRASVLLDWNDLPEVSDDLIHLFLCPKCYFTLLHHFFLGLPPVQALQRFGVNTDVGSFEKASSCPAAPRWKPDGGG